MSRPPPTEEELLRAVREAWKLGHILDQEGVGEPYRTLGRRVHEAAAAYLEATFNEGEEPP